MSPLPVAARLGVDPPEITRGSTPLGTHRVGRERQSGRLVRPRLQARLPGRVAVPRKREDPLDSQAAGHSTRRDHTGGRRMDAAAMVPRIDLDQCADARAHPAGRRLDGVHADQHGRAVGKGPQPLAGGIGGPQRVGDEQVVEATVREHLSLPDRRHGDATRPSFHLHAGDFEALVRLHVRAQVQAACVGERLRGGDGGTEPG